MWRIDHKFPGAAANDMYNELMNTLESGTGLLQNSSSEWAVALPLAGGLKFNIPQTVLDSSG